MNKLVLVEEAEERREVCGRGWLFILCLEDTVDTFEDGSGLRQRRGSTISLSAPNALSSTIDEKS